MKNLILNCLTFIFLLTISSQLYAQKKYKKVLQMPAVMESPLDQPNENYYPLAATKILLEDYPWMVFSDRADNLTRNGKVLDFMDDFYVVDQTDTDAYLVKAVLDGLKIRFIEEDVGWIEKNKLLLWNHSLIDVGTKINRKGFLLNKRSSIRRILENEDDKDRVRIFDRPNANKDNEINKNRIYEFFFVFKKDKTVTPEMYLLSKNVSISNNTKDDIIGWVKADRINEWNTRIALEPNFAPLAYTERKLDIENKGIKLYTIADVAKAYGAGKGSNTSEIIWRNDPVNLSREKLANEDSLRFKGGVIRFPMLQKDKDNNLFRTAVVGEVTLASLGEKVGEFSEIKFSTITKEVDRLNAAKNNINVLFVIDGTSGMQDYINNISSTVLDLTDIAKRENKSIKFGAAIYGSRSTIRFDYQPMNSDYNTIIDFVKSAKTSVGFDSNPYVSLYYGLSQALKKANLKKDQNNVVVVIGDTGDDYYSINDPSAVKPQDVERELEKWGAHIIGINCQINKGGAGKAFKDQLIAMITETAKLSYNKYKGVGSITKLDISNPLFVNNTLKGGSIYGAFAVVESPSGFSDILTGEIIKTMEYTEEVTRIVKEIFNNGGSYGKNQNKDTAGPFGPAISEILTTVKGELTFNDLVKLSNEKYQFYLEAYSPIKIDNTANECFSYVLFLPENDLKELRDRLGSLAISANGTPDQKRKSLIATWKELLRIYTGEKSFERLESYSIEKLNSMMQGVEKEGITFNTRKKLGNVKLGDLKRKRVVSNEQIDEYIKEVTKNYRQLDEILKDGKNYEFSYSSNDITYYWLPIDFLP